MPRIKGTTNAQTIFLRAFRNNPAGPPPQDWPAPAVLRRWLRRPTFRRALQSLQDSLRFQADFHLSNLATQAAQKLSVQDAHLTTLDLNRLLRMSHLRQRFNPPPATLGSHPGDAAKPENDEDRETSDRDPFYRGYYIDENGECRYPFNEGQKRIREIALKYEYLPPINLHDDFPAPSDTTDTYYYKLLHNPQVLLFYMKCYAHRFPDDTRFSKILRTCSEFVPISGRFPHFEDHEPPPPFPHPNPHPRLNPKASFGDPDPILGPDE